MPITVPRIKAHAYHVGDRYSSYLNAGIAQLCAPLRTADGALVFDSAVCERAGREQNGSADLAANVENLHHNNLYLTAYLPISGFAEQDAAMQELTLSYDTLGTKTELCTVRAGEALTDRGGYVEAKQAVYIILEARDGARGRVTVELDP